MIKGVGGVGGVGVGARRRTSNGKSYNEGTYRPIALFIHCVYIYTLD